MTGATASARSPSISVLRLSDVNTVFPPLVQELQSHFGLARLQRLIAFCPAMGSQADISWRANLEHATR
jgi:hypothetical protein